MSRYTTRVELHGADESDYERLHEEMRRRGFTKTITSTAGQVLHLPTAEYNMNTSDAIDAVLDLAKAASAVVKSAGNLRRDASILVTKSEARK